MKRLALGLLLLAGMAHATDYYASPTGSDANDGLSAGAPKTVTWYLNNATSGDNVYLADGTYPSSQTNSSGLFAQLHGGTAGQRVTYIGDITTPANVRFDAGWLLRYNVYGSLHGNSYVTLKGVSVNGSIELSGDVGGTPQQALRDSIVYCVADSGFAAARFDSCVVAFNTFGSNGADNTFHLGGGNFGNSHSFYNQIHYNAVYPGISGSSGGNAINLVRLDSCQVTSNRFYVRHYPSASTAVHSNTWFGLQNNLILDNHWIVRNDITSTSMYALNMRDSTRFNLLLRDTVRVDTLSTGTSKIYFSTSGTYGSSGYNTFNQCLFVANGPVGYQNTGDGDTHKFSQYVMEDGPFYFPFGNVVMDSVTFRHNTFFTEAARMWTMDTDTSTHALTSGRIAHNIFFSKSASAGTLMQYQWSVAGGERDSNLYYKVANDSSARFDYAYNSKDATSHWASPSFENPRWQTPHLTPAASSLAISSNLWHDGYAGAIGTGGVEEPADDDAPVVSFVSPGAGDEWKCRERRPIRWIATDDVGVVRIDLDYGVGASPTSWYAIIVNGSPTVAECQWTIPITGTLTLRLTATDAAANATAETETVTVTCPPSYGGDGTDE